MIRRTPDGRGGLVLDVRFLQAWLKEAGVLERLHLAFERLPPQPQLLERWDLWLEAQETLLRSPLEEALENELLQAVQELGDGPWAVRALLPEHRRAALQAEFPALRGAEALLEAVRLAWAAVLSSANQPQELLSSACQVAIQREAPAAEAAVPAPDELPACGPAASSDPAWGPDPCLLRLAELYNRLLLPGWPRTLQSFFDLRPWVDLPWAAPDSVQEERFLRSAEACGRSEAAELLERGRKAWAAWAASAPCEEPAGPLLPPEAPEAKPRSQPRFRQLAGAPGAPGLASGPARLLRPGNPRMRGAGRSGYILVCRRLPPEHSDAAARAAGLLTEEGGSLSFGAVLAARAGIPCVCGARGALACLQDGDLVVLDGRLGIAGIRPARRSG